MNGHVDNLTSFNGSQQTFPKLLQVSGYQTALIGKWHLESEPQGFDYWNILPGQGYYYNPDFNENGENRVINGYVTDIITDLAVQWMDERDPSKSFCILVHHKAPHRAWMPAQRHLNLYNEHRFPVPLSYSGDKTGKGKAGAEQTMEIARDMFLDYDLKVPLYHNEHLGPDQRFDSLRWYGAYNRMSDLQKNAWDSTYVKIAEECLRYYSNEDTLAEWKYQRYMQDYLGCIASVDESIGEILDYLDEHDLAGNTIVIYTSDQGFFLGEEGWFDKRFMYEPSLRIPLIVRYPEKIVPGIVDDMALNLDFAPTFLDYARLDVPDDMQGESLKPLLTGAAEKAWRNSIYYRYYEYPGPHMVKRHYGIRTERHKLIHFYYDIDEWELYDLEKDPSELYNLYGSPGYKALTDSLMVELRKLQREYGDNQGDPYLPVPDIAIDHLAKGSKIDLVYPYSEKYQGSGASNLVDGMRSSDTVSAYNSYDVWHGFEGDDLVAVIELDKAQTIESVTCGFLNRTAAWIFPPKRVIFYISPDGKEYTRIGDIVRTEEVDSHLISREEMSVNNIQCKARYIKVEAMNTGTCPQWHPGAGQKAWLFADEIVVK